MITVRPAREGDIPAILDLLVQVNMVHHNIRPDLFRGPAVKYSAGDLILLFQDPDSPVFVAEAEDGSVLGHCFCQLQQHSDAIFTDARTLYIDDICVDEKCRGRSVGRLLYHHAVDFARSSGCYNVTLNVWQGNDPAMAFYRNMGMSTQKITMEQIL